jgi:uncharacterized protein
MDFTGRYQIPVSPEAVWAGLNDPDILAAAIPGCETLTKTSDTEFSGVIVLKIGPMTVRLKGKVTQSEREPPHRMLLTGSGDGGDAGFATGGAEVMLTSKDGGTELTYKAGADIGGKLAQIGERLIHGAARQFADQFVDRFAAQLAPEPAMPAAEPQPHSRLWALGLIGVAAILIVFFLVVG